ncbi:MAG: bifunctional (p)ppGpp synthetase/guanosine-3',5'-bis(diphosphate) 3'-pyrophosphohydrolase [Candidatus Sumerlaeia bacterium]|nr:bifunctional (p)ppGpp synthetase/guanosine-3',5'-bis(diphosphate) 3'-pyrophosphohydrolase [Candidatus Sumerlaeia bacterium]
MLKDQNQQLEECQASPGSPSSTTVPILHGEITIGEGLTQGATFQTDESFHEISSIEQLLELTQPENRDVVRRAYELADRLHAGQVRSSGEPYIRHPLMVACYLTDLNMDAPTIAAGLLHDVLEDTELTREELEEQFPEPIPSIVQGVTKISRINFQTTREAQVENLRLMFLAMAKDVRVVIVKLCDRLHNMKTLKYLSEEKQVKISQETLDIYAPLANRLGMSLLKSELEDLAMRWLLPDAYRSLAEKIALKRDARRRFVHESVQFLWNHLQREASGRVLSITGRPKHFYSIYKKMKAQGLTFDQIYDLNAMRILCESTSECYEIMGLIHHIWPPLPGRFKDYIGVPKKNMYQSLHTTVMGFKGVVTEIQIRTRNMHQIAEYGIAAHWKYKEQRDNIKLDERLVWLRQLTEWISDENESSGLLDALKKDVFADHVLCFTPKGDVYELPAKATPIDFAFSIHTEIGYRCVGAKVNSRMVNLRTKLQNGDVVEILTSQTGHPSRDWLEYARTGRARQKIKHYLKGKNLDELVDNGRKELNRVLQDRGIEVSNAELDDQLKNLLSAYKMNTVEDLLVEIGFGSISASASIARMNPEWARRSRKPPKKRRPAPTKASSQPIHIGGIQAANVRIANCCKPIPGDPIVGFITRGRGVTVHSESCPNVLRARERPQDYERILEADWNPDAHHETNHAVTLRVDAEDRNGLLNEVTGIISDHHIFIEKCNTSSDRRRGTATLTFELMVRDVDQIARALGALRSIPGLISAERKRRGGKD